MEEPLDSINDCVVGSGYDKSDPEVLGEGHKSWVVVCLDGADVGHVGEAVGPAVAGDDVDVRDGWALGEFPCQCVLACALSDEEDFEAVGVHGDSRMEISCEGEDCRVIFQKAAG